MKRVIQIPTNWDLAYLNRFNARNDKNMSFEALAREIAAGFVAFNASLRTGYLSNFVTLTTSATADIEAGSGNDMLPPIAEHGKSDPVVGDTTSHMLPMRDYGGALKWGYWVLRREGLPKFQADIKKLITNSTNRWEHELFDRMFSNQVVTVANQGKSLPLADGGTADPDWTPPAKGGRVFEASLNHYKRYSDDSAGRIQYLTEAGKALKNQGLTGPFELVVPDVDESKWTGLNDAAAKFIRPDRSVVIVTNGVETRANVDENVYVGMIETPGAVFKLYTTARVPAGYAHTSKAYGFNKPGNLLEVRYEEGYELGLTLIAEVKHFPFEEAQAAFTFGVGIGGDRVNGFNGKFAGAGNYTKPAIS